jgi:hypothetical protein
MLPAAGSVGGSGFASVWGEKPAKPETLVKGGGVAGVGAVDAAAAEQGTGCAGAAIDLAGAMGSCGARGGGLEAVASFVGRLGKHGPAESGTGGTAVRGLAMLLPGMGRDVESDVDADGGAKRDLPVCWLSSAVVAASLDTAAVLDDIAGAV